ncbi:MAG TPA: flavin reductase family protein, partial [Candidatus Binatia bacterium]|nr:flavin reductase family protein [Candidatus Binatia bacterium]
MSDDKVKDALQLMHYGFYSITSCTSDDANIMVANWVMQASFEPRLIALALQKTSYTHGLIENGGSFAVNIFKQEDSEAIMSFTKGRSKNPDKMQEANYNQAPVTGCPVLDGATAYVECNVVKIVETGGDHDLVIGEVVGGDVLQEADTSDIL